MALSMYLKEHNQNLFRPQIQKVERINPNDKNATKVTGDNIIKNFGFRGGEFGNWVKQSERQQFLNYAQDAFTDLAEALGVIPESLGQKNAMAIAFGARGKGLSAAVAHFEPAKKVINMTRLKGAGSLAHEYGHSIDNYLSREGGWTEDGMATTNSINPKLSENMKKAVDNVVDAMVYNTSKNEEEIAKKNEIFEKNRKENLQYHMNYLDKVFAGEAERYKYNRKTKKDEKIKMAVTEEQKQKYKKIKKTLLEGKLKGEIERKTNFDNYKVETIYPKEIESIREMYKDIVGRKINDDTLYWLNRYGRPAKQVNEVKSESAYSKSAKELDQLMGRKTPYYSKTEEMWARAFESYVNDKLKAKGITNTYLVHSVNNDVYALFNPFPAGEERQNINKAFDNLIETMKAEGLFEDSNVLPFSNRNDVDDYFDSKRGIWYNKNGIEINSKTKKDLTSAINTDTPKLHKGNNYKEFRDHFYIFNKEKFNEYKILGQLRIEGNEDLINAIKGGYKNGIDTESTNINKIIQEVGNARRGSDNNASSSKRARRNRTADGLYNRDAQERETRQGQYSRESNANRNTKIKNSKQSSFIMPKNVKEIKNLNEFLRKAIPNETNKYWKEQLKEAQAANYTDWTRRESRLQWKRNSTTILRL